MMHIKVHNPCNSHTRYYRHYNLFWDMLTEELKRRYKVEENRYFENAHFERWKVNLQWETSDNVYLQECDYIIENLTTEEFFVMSVSDDLNHATLSERHNPKLKKVLISQFIPKKISHHVGIENLHRYSPWLYFQAGLVNLDGFYYRRKYLSSFIDKLYFRGTSLGDRPILNFFQPDILEGINPIGSPTAYFDDLIKYKIGLSIAGRGELCYRDIEYMALGIPFLRFEYQTQLASPLVPNYHYISVPMPSDMSTHYDLPCDRLGTESHANLLQQRFLEVKDDTEFLQFISNNAREYYERYLMPRKNVEHTLNLLNL